MPGQSTADFQNLSPKCDFFIILYLDCYFCVTKVFQKAGNFLCPTVAVATIGITVEEKKTHLITACLQRSREIELSLVIRKYSYI